MININSSNITFNGNYLWCGKYKMKNETTFAENGRTNYNFFTQLNFYNMQHINFI